MIVIKHDLIPTKLPECCGKCRNRVGYMCMLRGKYVEDFDTSIIDPNCPLVEVFTKDEVITMLTELRLEIEKIFDNRPLPCSHYQRTLFYGEVDDLIFDKIKALKG